MLLRVSSLLLAAIGIVAFPWPLTLFFICIAALFVPQLALLFGVLIDILYFVPGAFPVPLFTVLGLIGFVLALLVHSVVKARIMGA